MLCLVPIQLIFDKYTFMYQFLLLCATFVPLLICKIASRFRLVSVEFILPLTTFCRGLTALMLRRHLASKLDCFHPALKWAFDFFGLSLFLTDAILFRGNFYVVIFIVIPIYMFFVGVQLTNTYKYVGICNNVTKNSEALSYILQVTATIPAFYGLFTQ